MKHRLATAFDITIVAALALAAVLWIPSNPAVPSVPPRQDALGNLQFTNHTLHGPSDVSWMPLKPPNNWRQLLDDPM